MSQDFSLEIFNQELKAWVSLNLAQFYHLFFNLEFSGTDSDLYFSFNHIFKSGLEFRFNLNKNNSSNSNNSDLEPESPTHFKVEDYVEVKKEIYANFKMDLENSKLELVLKDEKYPYTIWAREKVISQGDDYLTFSSVNDTVERSSTKNIRRLSERENDCEDINLVFKRIVVSKVRKDIEEIINEITEEYKFDNLFFNLEEVNGEIAINICSEQINILFFYNILLIKLETEKKLRKLEEEIKLKESYLNKLSKIFNDENTLIFNFSKEFQQILENKILIPLKNIDGLDYMIINGDTQDRIKILILKGNKEEMFLPLSRLKENSIDLDTRIADWLKTDRLNNFNKIVENSKITGYSFNGNKLLFIGEEKNLNIFNNMLSIDLKFGEKILNKI